MLRSRLIGTIAVILVCARLAWAGATTPDLILASGSTMLGSGGVWTLSLTAAYDYSNAVQAAYDLELIVHQGQTFVRFPLSGSARTGMSPALADGLGTADLPALDAASALAPAGVRVVSFDATSIIVTLPPSFQAGAVTASLAATVDEGPVLSNPLGLVLP
jgi:hypothetical protein